MSALASTSRRLLPSALPRLRWARHYATESPAADSTSPTLSSSPSTVEPTPKPVTPLPGSAVLPEAFRAAQQPSSTPSLRTSSAPSPYSPVGGRRGPRLSQPYKLHVYSTRNNTILTLSTSPAGADAGPQDPHVPIAWVTAGSAGYKGAARGTYDAAVEVTLKMFQKVKDLIEPPVLAGGQKKKAAGPAPTELEVVWKGFGQGRDAVFRTLMGAEGDEIRSLVKRVTDATPLKIGVERAGTQAAIVSAPFSFTTTMRRSGLVLPRLARLVVLLSCAVALVASTRPRPFALKKRNPTYSPLSASSVSTLAQLNDLDKNLDFRDPESLLSKLLIPRAVGSANLTKVQRLVEDKFVKLGWHVERDSFTASTPIGSQRFTNLVFTHDPSAVRRFVLSAHLDSKYFPHPPQDQFIGATDSAAPCAILFDVAESLTDWLNEKRDRVQRDGPAQGEGVQAETLQIVLFDGEEAFHEWSATDSIYGARHLVEEWSKPTLTPSPQLVVPSTPLQRISHLVLLDLLGAPNPVIRSFYPPTAWLFDEFLESERKLGKLGLLFEGYKGEAYLARAGQLGVKERSFFVDRHGKNVQNGGWFGSIEDDHVPFVKKGVPVVHLISVPFPRVWHTIADDASALDYPTIKAWALIVRLTVAEYLGLEPKLDKRGSGEAEDDERIAGRSEL
ncbi:hypothetical protein JCM10212_003655 [Sporobolomyces blumeae]